MTPPETLPAAPRQWWRLADDRVVRPSTNLRSSPPGTDLHGVLIDRGGRTVWTCPHAHRTDRAAFACARDHLQAVGAVRLPLAPLPAGD